jgi:hypothetical protein
VSESWRRSLAVGVDPEADVAPTVYAEGDVAAVREEHPLAEVLPVLRSTLVSSADEAMHLMIVTDVEGCILWREGSTDVRLRADRAGLAEGTRWSEDAIGTNAMGTTLALDRPVSIHSAEHLVRAYHDWTCSAAPVHDPETGALIGSIDITGPTSSRHPSTLALVTAAAQLAENALRQRMAAHDAALRDRYLPRLLGGGALLSPSGRVLASVGMSLPARVDLPSIPDGLLEPLGTGFLLRPGGAGRVVLDFLGAVRPVAVVGGRVCPLSPRHADILAVLALHPRGRTAEQLALDVHGERGNAVTARAEVHRLRAALGEDVVRTRPYRLAADVVADFLAVPGLLRAGRLADAASAGPLLPLSEAPAVREHRLALQGMVRRAVIDRGGPDDLWALAEATGDAEAWELVSGLLPWDDPRLPIARARVDLARPVRGHGHRRGH